MRTRLWREAKSTGVDKEAHRRLWCSRVPLAEDTAVAVSGGRSRGRGGLGGSRGARAEDEATARGDATTWAGADWGGRAAGTDAVSSSVAVADGSGRGRGRSRGGATGGIGGGCSGCTGNSSSDWVAADEAGRAAAADSASSAVVANGTGRGRSRNRGGVTGGFGGGLNERADDEALARDGGRSMIMEGHGRAGASDAASSAAAVFGSGHRRGRGGTASGISVPGARADDVAPVRGDSAGGGGSSVIVEGHGRAAASDSANRAAVVFGSGRGRGRGRGGAAGEISVPGVRADDAALVRTYGAGGGGAGGGGGTVAMRIGGHVGAATGHGTAVTSRDRRSNVGAADAAAGITAVTGTATARAAAPRVRKEPAPAPAHCEPPGVSEPRLVTHSLTVQGPQQARAMVNGKKQIENRGWRIPPGWYALHVGSKPLSSIGEEWCTRMLKAWPDVPPERSLPSSSIVGLIHVLESRRPFECPGEEHIQSVWAVGPICHIIDQAIQLRVPIRHQGRPNLWEISAEARELLVSQLDRLEVQTFEPLPRRGAAPLRR
eukprot:NODE_3568_length_2017_cov_9.927513.p1 GENE.NODE_3568_length_2017_cov_9.927513~~NODE_3568_length_2017_cov_9.927513.p1  ORF type:complete len:568 (-),score=143.14 NODE_3568_length_2017_cov_9.927513:313-1956(-)